MVTASACLFLIGVALIAVTIAVVVFNRCKPKKLIHNKRKARPCHVGSQGQTGAPGCKGPPGFVGKTGCRGVQGHRGCRGEKGDEGDKGCVGHRGERGFRGDRGDVGPAGNQGPPGPQGLQGPRGIQGNQGIPGAQGSQGFVGVSGNQGLVGAQGNQGALARSPSAIYYSTSGITVMNASQSSRFLYSLGFGYHALARLAEPGEDFSRMIPDEAFSLPRAVNLRSLRVVIESRNTFASAAIPITPITTGGYHVTIYTAGPNDVVYTATSLTVFFDPLPPSFGIQEENIVLVVPLTIPIRHSIALIFRTQDELPENFTVSIKITASLGFD